MYGDWGVPNRSGRPDLPLTRPLRCDWQPIGGSMGKLMEKYGKIIGSKSISRYSALMEKCSTILWNGPLGVFESPPFDRGTVELACRVGELSCSGSLISVAGGGDTLAALSHAGAEAGFSYVSTAGGAFLEWLEGANLPGIEALTLRGTDDRTRRNHLSFSATF